MEKKLAPPRRVRADAQRNRTLILEVAKQAFTRDGANASLDEMARQAGIGSATLYRHFPTREALIEAVYHGEVENLAAAEVRLAGSLDPVAALRAWMLLFIDHVAEKTLILPAMDLVPGGSMGLIAKERDRIHSTFARAVRRAVESGGLRADTQPEDFVRALVGVFHTASVPGWEESARRLVDILIDGSRRRPRPDASSHGKELPRKQRP